MLHCKSSLKAVLCRWHLTLSESKQQQKKLSPVKTFPNTRAVSAGVVRAPGRGSAGVPAVWAAVIPMPCWVPQPPRQCWVPWPGPPSNPRALNFAETLFSSSPHCHGHTPACHSHKSSWTTALLREKLRQCHAEQHHSSLLADCCRPELNQALLRGWAQEQAGALLRLF